MIRNLLLFFLVLNALICFAQKKEKPVSEIITQPYRFETIVGDQDDEYIVVSAKENGIIYFRKSSEKVDNGLIPWEFNMLDTALAPKWNAKLKLNSEFILNGYECTSEKLYLMFQKGQYKTYEYQFLTIDLVSLDTTQHSFVNALPLDLTEFYVKNNVAVLGGKVNFRSVIMLFDFATNKQKVVPGFYNTRSELLQIKMDQYDSAFDVLVNERLANNFTISTKTYSLDGELLQNIILKPTEGMSLLWGSTTAFEDDARLIAGTYSPRVGAYSRGIFISRIDRKGGQTFSYINYGDLTNFFSYLKAKRQERLKEKIVRRKIKGKKLKFNYRLMVHDIIKSGDQYIMIAEAYYPVYSNQTSLNSGFYASQGSLVFDGYRYTHAVVIGFDKQGNLLWDNSFEINDVKSYTLKKYVQIAPDNEKVVLMYIFEDVIRSKIISGNQILEGKTFNPVALKFEQDVLKNDNTELSAIEPWHGNAFFAHGVQRIKNISSETKEVSRKVFYINKVVYK